MIDMIRNVNAIVQPKMLPSPTPGFPILLSFVKDASIAEYTNPLYLNFVTLCYIMLIYVIVLPYGMKILIDPSEETSKRIERLAKDQCRSVKNMTEVLVEKGLEASKN